MLAALCVALPAASFCVAGEVPASGDSGKRATAPVPAVSAPAIPLAPPANGPVPDVALLLPLQSPDFGRAADAVRRGFFAALKRHESRLVTVTIQTDAGTEQILGSYEAAIRLGAKIVVGPMTRGSVSALAASTLVTVPTLALNVPDGDPALPRRFYWFGLSADAEARQVATMAWRDEQKICFIVHPDTALGRRGAQAFAEAFRGFGGRVMQVFAFNPSDNAFPQIRDRLLEFESGCVFLAADADQARLVRPYLSNSLTVYATSLINAPDATPRDNVDLNGIRFVDMPWLLQPDHPAVMIYPRLEQPGEGDVERFYALGIDAFRIASEFQRSPRVPQLDIDGVTGRIRLGRNNQILREPTAATFRDGIAQPRDDAAPRQAGR